MNITIERFEQIEQERNETSSDPNFHKWMSELNVSRMHTNSDGIFKAREMMSDYNFSILTEKKNLTSILNLFLK
jgi:hypothetical protein